MGNQKEPPQTFIQVETLIQAFITSGVKAKFPALLWSKVRRLYRPCHPPFVRPPVHPPNPLQHARLKARGDGQELLIPGGGRSHGGSAAAVQRSKQSGSSEIECGRSVAGSDEGHHSPVHSVTPAVNRASPWSTEV